jgi:hypothetical protein
MYCKVTMDVPAGQGQTLSLTTLGMHDQILAQATQAVNIIAGKTQSVAPRFQAVARSLALRASTGRFWQGSPGLSAISVYGVDASGNLIPSQDVVGPSGKPIGGITLSASGPYTQKRMVDNGATFPPFRGLPFSSAAFRYDGRFSGTETITATMRNGEFPPASLALTLEPEKTVPTAEIFAATENPGGELGSSDQVVEFAPGVSGNVSPLRALTFREGALVPFGADGHGGFWAGGTNGGAVRYDGAGKRVDSGPRLETGQYISLGALDSNYNLYVAFYDEWGGEVSCSGQPNYVRRYAAGFGSGRILGTLSLEWDCVVRYLAVDGLGDLYVGEYSQNPLGSNANIVEYGPSSPSGARSIVRTISQTSNAYFGGMSTLQPFAGDAKGNLFEVNLPGSTGLLEYPAGSTTPQTVLEGIPIGAFSLDRHGHIFAEVPTSATAFSIEEFAPGSTIPMRTIGGPSTKLTIPAGIAVDQ